MTLSNQDLSKIDGLINTRVSRRLESHKEDLLEEIASRLMRLKSDIFDRIDPVLKEVVTSREERPLIENRIEKLEEIHPQGKHPITISQRMV